MIHQQGFQGIADRGIICFGIQNHLPRFYGVRVCVDEDMADSIRMPEYRNLGAGLNRLDQLVASARDDQIQFFTHLDQL